MITVLSGSNTQAIREKLAAIKEAFIKQHGSEGVETVAGEQLQPEQLNSLLSGATLFALDRLVIVRGLSENKLVAEQYLKVLDSISDQTQVVLVEGGLDKRTVFYKTLKKQAELLEFAELDEVAATNWVKESVKKQGGEIDSGTARLLVRYAGTDQSRLTNEVAKLVAYDSKITPKTIEELVEKRPEDTIFQLLEYALSGKTNQALSVLEGLEKAHEDPFQTASMLIWQTNILAIVHSGKEIPDSEIAKSAKLNPFVVKKTRSLARGITRPKLNSILNRVAECDVALKSSSTEPWRILERTILSIEF